MAGKGDKPRPVNKSVFDKNYAVIFGKKVPVALRRVKSETKCLIKKRHQKPESETKCPNCRCSFEK